MLRIPCASQRLLATCVAGFILSPAHGTETHLSPWQRPISALPIVQRIKVPVGPAWLETGFGSVWVTKIDDSTVLRIDPPTGQIVAQIRVGSHPDLAIGIGMNSVWIADTKDRTITQIDPMTNKVVRTIPAKITDETEGSIGIGAGSLWVLTNENGTDSGTLSRIDPKSGKVIANIALKPKSHAAIFAFESVWVTSTGGGSVTRIDPHTNAMVAEIPVHAAPRFIAASADSVWVLCQGDGSLARIDPLTNRVVATIAVGVPGEGGDLSIGEGYVWVSAEGVPLSQIDPRTNNLIRQYVGGEKDDTLRVDFGSAWIIDELKGQVWKVNLKLLEKHSG